MGSLTVTANRIVRQAANTIPGNATGAVADCQSLTPSDVRTFLGMATTSDVTFDIVRATTSVLSPLFKNGSAVTTLGDVTYGVSIPGTSSFGVNQWINSSEGSNRILFAPASHTYFDSPGQFLFRNAGGATYGTINAATLDHPTAALTLGNSTYGVTVPGQIAMTGSSAYITSGGEIIAGTDSSGFYFGGGLAAVNRHVNIGNLGSSLNTRILNAALLIGTTTDNGSGAKLQVAGAATFSGDISMQKATQGYIYSYDTAASSYARMYKVGAGNAYFESSTAGIELAAANGYVYAYKSGQTSRFVAYDSGGTKFVQKYHDGTNGILSTSSGNLNIVPTGGTVAVTGAGSFSRAVSGSTQLLTVENTSSSTVGNHAVLSLITTGSGGGSPYVTFANIGNFVWSAGIDNADGDSFKICESAGLSAFNYFKIASAGAATFSSTVTCAGITASDLVTIGGPTGASGGVTSLNITDGANATFRLSFENANRIMLSGNEGAHNLSFGGKSGNSGTSPFTERFRVDNVANQVVSYSPFICTSITASGLIRGAETTSTPSGTTQTITLETGNCQTLDLTSSTGDVTATLTVPASSARGSLLIKQHATTSRDITWAASSGTITWLGTEPTWNADATSAYREVEWRFNGTNTFLIPSGSS